VRFDWDERKRAANVAKHGLDLADAAEMFSGPVLETDDERRDYRERRVVALGVIAGRVVTCVYTDRNAPDASTARRVISLRFASRGERARYVAHTGASP
jgi:uncharacterized protein